MEVYNSNQDQEAYKMAKQKVKKIKGFYTHLLVYLLVNTFIIVLNIKELDEGESYFQFHNFTTAFFWGIGLVAHGFSVFVPYFIFGKDWENKKIKEFMNKEKNDKWE